MKDEPKWLAGSSETSAKRTKNLTLRTYFSSSNSLTPTNNEYNQKSRILLRSTINKKGDKRKENENLMEISTPGVKFDAFKLKKLL